MEGKQANLIRQNSGNPISFMCFAAPSTTTQIYTRTKHLQVHFLKIQELEIHHVYHVGGKHLELCTPQIYVREICEIGDA